MEREDFRLEWIKAGIRCCEIEIEKQKTEIKTLQEQYQRRLLEIKEEPSK